MNNKKRVTIKGKLKKKYIIDGYNLNDIPAGNHELEKHHPVGSTISCARLIKGHPKGDFFHMCYDPVFLYLGFCESILEEILNLQAEIEPFKQKDRNGKEIEGALICDSRKLNQLMELTISFVTVLFSAFEAFLNQNIKYDFVYKRDGKEMSRDEILDSRRISIHEKLTTIYCEMLGKDIKTQKNLYESFKNLKEIRNEITHLKSVNPIPDFKAPDTEYDSHNEDGSLKVIMSVNAAQAALDSNARLVTNLFNLNIHGAFLVVTNIMNFFIDDYVEVIEDPETPDISE